MNYAISLTAHKNLKEMNAQGAKFSSETVEEIAKQATNYSGLETCVETLRHCFKFKSVVAVKKAVKELVDLGFLRVKRTTSKGYVIYEFV